VGSEEINTPISQANPAKAAKLYQKACDHLIATLAMPETTVLATAEVEWAKSSAASCYDFGLKYEFDEDLLKREARCGEGK